MKSQQIYNLERYSIPLMSLTNANNLIYSLQKRFKELLQLNRSKTLCLSLGASEV